MANAQQLRPRRLSAVRKFLQVGSVWLAKTIPGTRRRIDLAGARLFFPEERARELNAELLAHWQAAA